MATFSGKVASFSKSQKTFLIDSASITLADGSETRLIRNGDVVRGLVDDWRFGGVPEIGDVVMFMDNPVHGEIRAMPVFEDEAVVIEEPHQFDLGACKGDDATLPLNRSQTTDVPPREQVVQLTFGGIVSKIREALSRGFKARAAARS